jgi:hypothetical protein
MGKPTGIKVNVVKNGKIVDQDKVAKAKKKKPSVKPERSFKDQILGAVKGNGGFLSKAVDAKVKRKKDLNKAAS